MLTDDGRASIGMKKLQREPGSKPEHHHGGKDLGPNLPSRAGKKARTQAKACAKNDAPRDRAEDDRTCQDQRVSERRVLNKGSLTANDCEPEPDIPRTGQSEC